VGPSRHTRFYRREKSQLNTVSTTLTIRHVTIGK
jgi:hypothetical protein